MTKLIALAFALFVALSSTTASAQTPPWVYQESYLSRDNRNNGVCFTGIADGFRPWIYFQNNGNIEGEPLTLDEESRQKLQAYADRGETSRCFFSAIHGGGMLTVNGMGYQMADSVVLQVAISPYGPIPQMRLDPFPRPPLPVPPRRSEVPQQI